MAGTAGQQSIVGAVAQKQWMDNLPMESSASSKKGFDLELRLGAVVMLDMVDGTQALQKHSEKAGWITVI